MDLECHSKNTALGCKDLLNFIYPAMKFYSCHHTNAHPLFHNTLKGCQSHVLLHLNQGESWGTAVPIYFRRECQQVPVSYTNFIAISQKSPHKT